MNTESRKKPEFCTCHDGYWMRNLVDPSCHYHGDYADELRALITDKDAEIARLQQENRLLKAEMETIKAMR